MPDSSVEQLWNADGTPNPRVQQQLQQQKQIQTQRTMQGECFFSIYGILTLKTAIAITHTETKLLTVKTNKQGRF